MTPEQIADYRNVAHAFGGSDGSVAGRVLAECLSEIERLQPLAMFGQRVLDKTKECISDGMGELDIADTADQAVTCGLIQWVAYDPGKHDVVIDFCGEPGDMIYYWESDQ